MSPSHRRRVRVDVVRGSPVSFGLRYRLAAGTTGAATGLGLGLMLVHGEHLAAIFACFLAAALVLAIRLAAPLPHARPLGAILGLSFAVHVALCATIYLGSLAAGRGGFVTGDDASYARVSSGVARYLAGEPIGPYVPPDWGGDAYLLGAWVYLEAALFLVFGERLLPPLLVNAALAIGTAFLFFDISDRLFGARAGLATAAIIAFYPSLVLWSSLNLKDTLAVFLIAAVLWCLIRSQLRPHWPTLAFAAVLLIVLETVRWYVFVGLALLLPVAVMLSHDMGGTRRIRWTLAAAAVSVALLAGSGAGATLDGGILSTLESTRANMALEARTGFVIPSRPPEASELALRRDGAFLGTLAYLPVGLAYVLFAPFPWATRSASEVVAIPEMAIWYALLLAVPWTLWRARALWRSYFPLVGFAAGMILVLALAEGNVGTLFRHRAMIVPAVVALAVPALLALWDSASASRRKPIPAGLR